MRRFLASGSGPGQVVETLRCVSTAVGTVHHRFPESTPITGNSRPGEVDYEGEMALVIGRAATLVREEDARDHVASCARLLWHRRGALLRLDKSGLLPYEFSRRPTCICRDEENPRRSSVSRGRRL